MTNDNDINSGPLLTEESSQLSLNQENDDDDDTFDEKPLDERILDLVEKNPSKVYPTRLVTELGLSHEDASAELCGLLAAVGSDASFKFECLGDDDSSNNTQRRAEIMVMCFSFPKDFRKKAKRSRAKLTFWNTFWNIATFASKLLKILTAFGLIISLLIVTIAAMIGLVAVLVAMSRGEGNRHQNYELTRSIQRLFFSMRQLLWCYAMFGHHSEGQDPFLREMAYDLTLMTSFGYGDSGLFWFWWHSNQMSRRRYNRQRTWGRVLQQQSNYGDIQGVSIRSERRWDDVSNASTSQDLNIEATPNEHRGMLSLAVEFLFGPIPFAPGPTSAQKWKLRAAVIMELYSKNGSVSLQELGPFLDAPPSSFDDNNADEVKLRVGSLAIITHFHGIPKQQKGSNASSNKEDEQPRFSFPELLAESMHAANYEESLTSDDGTWRAFLFVPDVVVVQPNQQGELPSSLQEQRYRLTMLTCKQFLQCVIAGLLNLIGVWWLSLSLGLHGVLADLIHDPSIVYILGHTVVRFLRYYSVLFFALPIGRLLLICGFNFVREKRNRNRADLAHILSTKTTIS